MKNLTENLPKLFVLSFLGFGLFIIVGSLFGLDKETAKVAVTVPDLSEAAREGKALFVQNCQACHGKNAAGSENGPPFIHVIYRPNHHADGAFVLAARQGVRAHHWQFGNMPAQPQVTEKQVLKIVQYVRELQRANGIN